MAIACTPHRQPGPTGTSTMFSPAPQVGIQHKPVMTSSLASDPHGAPAGNSEHIRIKLPWPSASRWPFLSRVHLPTDLRIGSCFGEVLDQLLNCRSSGRI